MVYFAITAALLLILPLFGFLPRVKWHSNQAVNNVFLLEMPAPAHYEANGQSMIGVYAQERVEFWIHWLTNLLFMAPGAYAIDRYGPVGVIGLLAGFLVAALVRNTNAYDRQSELLGHATEVLVAGRNGFDHDSYLLEEAARTVNNPSSYGTMFKSYTVLSFAKAMQRRMWVAKILVGLHFVALKRMKRN